MVKEKYIYIYVMWTVVTCVFLVPWFARTSCGTTGWRKSWYGLIGQTILSNQSIEDPNSFFCQSSRGRFSCSSGEVAETEKVVDVESLIMDVRAGKNNKFNKWMISQWQRQNSRVRLIRRCMKSTKPFSWAMTWSKTWKAAWRSKRIANEQKK